MGDVLTVVTTKFFIQIKVVVQNAIVWNLTGVNGIEPKSWSVVYMSILSKERQRWESGSRLDKMCCDIFFSNYVDWKRHKALECKKVNKN